MADVDYANADLLQAQLGKAPKWPVPWEDSVRKDIQLWAALYNTDRDTLKELIEWDEREYVADPLPTRISDAYADLIFGEDPTFTSAQEEDQTLLDDIIEENNLPSELQRATALVSSQGEAWWRVYVDASQSPVPTIEWHSRLNVVPLLRGKHVVAVAFISTLDEEKENEDQVGAVWRYVEIQATGLTRNLLYKGTRDKLGNERPLTEHDHVEDLDEEWTHGIDAILAGRIVNGFGSTYAVGKSDYVGVKDLLLALNESATIGQKNARLTARKRVIVPDSYLDQHGRPPLDDDVIIRSEAHSDPDKPDSGFAQLEWDFDAEALIAYQRDLIGKIASRVGLTLHFVDSNSNDGTADSGTALRLRMLPSSIAAQGRARYWDDGLPHILQLMQTVDALDEGSGGFGRSWVAAEEIPAVERTDPIPRDPVEDANMVVALRTASLISLETAINTLYPDWSDERKQDELDKLETEQEAQGFSLNGGGSGSTVQPPSLEPGTSAQTG